MDHEGTDGQDHALNLAAGLFADVSRGYALVTSL
jgi:hypothetical protein